MKCEVKVNVTFKVTFELELKKIEMPTKPKLLHKLYLEGEFSDTKIFCDGKVFNCHKIILSRQSDVFKKMLVENDTKEATSGKIEITDISATTMENLLFYFYHEDLFEDEAKIVIDVQDDYRSQFQSQSVRNDKSSLIYPDFYIDLLMAANKYDISGLVKICAKVLKERLSKKSVVDVMTAAFLLPNQEDLFEMAYQLNFKLRIRNQNVDIEAWKELEEKNPNLAKQMMDPKMMKKANISPKILKESLPSKIEASHQKWIKATEEWTQETRKGKRATYFDRNFSINDMTWRRLGNLKFNVKLETDSYRWLSSVRFLSMPGFRPCDL